MNRLDSKVALISGAVSGIGAETARLMIEAGAKVAIADVQDDRGRELAQALAAAGGQAFYAHLDVTREDDWAVAVNEVIARFGALDILVNNAGVFLPKGIEDSTLSDWKHVCAVNLTGVFLGTKAAIPALRDHGATSLHGSAIVNLSSIAGLVGSAMAPLYSMTKGGILTFTKSAALEFGRKGYRIRVNCIHPGIVDNEVGRLAIATRARQQGIDDIAAVRKQVSAAYPIGRIDTMADIASGIIFLASDDSGFMTGSGLVVDGGWTAQ
jgi:NAD(P)-dependent dehydrogenase (short-subunit alcohol dehydrogenase family)